jgi:hypothetical protein
MAALPGLTLRDDFRCSLCQRKNAFHCEHDTPYRDQLLGTHDQAQTYMTSTTNRRESRRKDFFNNNTNSTSNIHIQHSATGRNNINSSKTAKHQPDRKADHSALSHANSSDILNTNEQQKKKKSCVIL